jgi:hypothetical protein
VKLVNNGNAHLTPLNPLLKRLAVCLDDLVAMEGIDHKSCRELKEKLTSHTFNLLVVGQFNRGKPPLEKRQVTNNREKMSSSPAARLSMRLSSDWMRSGSG